ncbi:MAG: ATP-binding protein [Candidatus Hodarchaeota archaeon]
MSDADLERKIVGIVSGKGGVGKTSLTASLASLAYKDSEVNPIVLDVDVDAPNLALILPANFMDEKNIKPVYTTLKASFIEQKCTHCKKCYTNHFCEFNALDWNKEKSIPIIDFLLCEGCSACKVLCPEHAFEIEPVKSGEVISYNTKDGFPLIYGKTRLGSTTSGKLVSDVKEHMKSIEKFSESNLILIDGPPGIGCPVIATITGLDYVVTITEPTPSGLHDLIRVIELINQFNIRFGIIINKADLKSSFQKDFEKFIKKTKYPILGRINFDLSIPKAMSYAEPVVNYAPNSEASISIKEIYSNLKKLLWDSN